MKTINNAHMPDIQYAPTKGVLMIDEYLSAGFADVDNAKNQDAYFACLCETANTKRGGG